MYKVLYRAYRPETFEDMLGQKHIVKILRHQIKENKIHHAYLFCGTRGTGKTTTARLLAKGVNCLSDGERPCGVCDNCVSIKEGTYLDIIEIDAASNNGVDNIREIRESVKYPPAMGTKKVYIIDEVHMLSASAFNAFLKTLEEPPEYVTFILATTEPHKLPATILSRCLRLDFRRVPEEELLGSMKNICKEQGVEIDDDALRIIAVNADGSARDGLTLLDQCISFGQKQVSRNDVLEALGTVDDQSFIELSDAALMGDTARGIKVIGEILSEGKDPRQIMSGWMNHYRNLLMIKFVRAPEKVINMSLENIERLKEQAQYIDIEDINLGINIIAENIQIARTSTQPRILLEIAFIKLCKDDYSAQPKVIQRPEFSRAQIETQNEAQKQVQAQVQKESVTMQAEELPPWERPSEAPIDLWEATSNEEPPSFFPELDKSDAVLKGNTLDNPRKNSGNSEEPPWNNRTDSEETVKTEGKPKENQISGKKLTLEEILAREIEKAEGNESSQESFAQDNFRREKQREDVDRLESVNMTHIDLDRAWQKIVEDGAKERASFNILNYGAKLVEITEKHFVLDAGIGAKTYLEQYKGVVEELFKKHTGYDRRLNFKDAEGIKKSEPSDKVKQIENALGIKITEE